MPVAVLMAGYNTLGGNNACLLAGTRYEVKRGTPHAVCISLADVLDDQAETSAQVQEACNSTAMQRAHSDGSNVAGMLELTCGVLKNLQRGPPGRAAVGCSVSWSCASGGARVGGPASCKAGGPGRCCMGLMTPGPCAHTPLP